MILFLGMEHLTHHGFPLTSNLAELHLVSAFICLRKVLGEAGCTIVEETWKRSRPEFQRPSTEAEYEFSTAWSG